MRAMARYLRGLLDRLLLVSAVVAGGLVPGFIAQYRQRLEGRLDQARIDLASWQKIAEQLFHGDINQLIRYHLASSDRTFHAEADVILSLVATVQRLQEQASALQTGLFRQARYLAIHLDPSLARATLTDWVPTFALSFEGVWFALALGGVIWLLFHLVWWTLSLCVPRRRSTRSAAPAARVADNR